MEPPSADIVDPAGDTPLAGLPGPHLTRADIDGIDLVGHLLETAAAFPQPVVAHADGSFFAPHLATVGCVGVRGADHIASVLTDTANYAPLSPAVDDLPPDVQKLSEGVFTMHGHDHDRYRRQLRGLFTLDGSSTARMNSAIEVALDGWAGARLDLVDASRQVAGDVWAAVLFGGRRQDRELARLVSRVVDGRRARRTASTPTADRLARRHTVRASRALDRALRDWFDEGCGTGLLAQLDDPTDPAEARTRAVAHATAVFAAASEPAAASLAWAILALSQRPDLAEASRGDTAAIDRLLRETQRLVPSSAIVTRSTLRPVRIAGRDIPAGCEVMISSLLAQRDPATFADPLRFDPGRWRGPAPARFAFFPFGAGARACLGAGPARQMLGAVLGALLDRGVVLLPVDCHVGWRMPDALMPSAGIPIELGSAGRPPGRARGPLSRLVRFDALDGPHAGG